MEQKYPKWRELLIEPNNIGFNTIRFNKIINYLPAGNDVLECNVNYNGIEQNVYIKIERSKMSCFDIEIKHINAILVNNYYSKVPKIIESGFVENKRFIVLEKVDGIRLSELLASKNQDKDNYLYRYGVELGKIHQIPIQNFEFAKQRIINDYPKEENYKNIDKSLQKYINYLIENKPDIKINTFIHGDFHYANLLWKNHDINCVLDWEYSGIGFKEQDIAWALILRPGQKFMDSIMDIKTFLNGYQKENNYDVEKLRWCLINGYCHFYLMNIDNEVYKQKIKQLLEQIYVL